MRSIDDFSSHTPALLHTEIAGMAKGYYLTYCTFSAVPRLDFDYQTMGQITWRNDVLQVNLFTHEAWRAKIDKAIAHSQSAQEEINRRWIIE